MDEERSEFESREHFERCRRAGEAWGRGGPASGRGAAVNWWSEKQYRLGALDAVQARIDSDTQRLQAGPGRDQLIWQPRHGAVAALVHYIADSEERQPTRPKHYYSISRLLVEATGRWTDRYVMAHSAFVGVKVALCQTDYTHNRYNPALAPDGQPIPGSARFNPVPGTTLDFVITWNDFWGFSVSAPYLNPVHDLVAMIG
jgi:hypothetical protein